MAHDDSLRFETKKGNVMMPFGRPDEKRLAAIRALKVLARDMLGAGEDDAIVVNELACTEPGCPPLETVVALLRSGEKPRQVKVHKPAVEVTEADLRAALDAPHDHEGARSRG
jgi:hypothetical protein